MITLKENERLVQVGTVALRAPNGDMRPNVPQYMIVSADKAGPDAIAEIGENKRLVYGGQVFSNRKLAEERYAAIMAGRKPAPREEGKPLYFIEDTDGINPKTGLTAGDELDMNFFSNKLAEIFTLQMQKNS